MSNPLRCATVLAALAAALVELSAGSARADDRILGVSFAAGAPTGAEATLMLRPVPFLRFEGGLTTDVVAPGFHAGFTLAVPWYISPVLNVEVGHQYGGDWNKLVQIAGASASNPLLANVAYSYGSAHVGLELGFPNHFMIFAHAGYSVIRAETNGLSAYLSSQKADLGLAAGQEGRVQVIAPSAKAGILFWIF
jgi:hypothetical protein